MKYSCLNTALALVCLGVALTGCGDQVVFYSGAPATTRIYEESFKGALVQKQDFLFIVDNSGSMARKIYALRDEIQNFVTKINGNGVIDFQAAVTLTDAISVRGDLVASSSGVRVAKSSSGTAVTDFAGILSAAVGNTPTSGVEMGFISAQLSIQNHGSEFMRPGVPLAILFFSDADDQSCDLNSSACVSSPLDSPYRVATPVSQFALFFKDLSVPVSVFSMAGVSKATANPAVFTNACSDMEGVGRRYAELQSVMGMQSVRNICPDQIPSGIDFVAQTVADAGSCFKLAHEANGLYFEVSYGGRALSAAEYSWQGASQSLCLKPGLITDSHTALAVEYEAFLPL